MVWGSVKGCCYGGWQRRGSQAVVVLLLLLLGLLLHLPTWMAGAYDRRSPPTPSAPSTAEVTRAPSNAAEMTRAPSYAAEWAARDGVAADAVLPPLHETTDRRSSFPFVSGDTFRAVSRWLYDETTSSRDAWRGADVAAGDLVFVKGDRLGEFRAGPHRTIRHPYLLLVHNSDARCPGDHAAMLGDAHLARLYCQNRDAHPPHPKLRALPIGLANHLWPHGDREAYRAAMALVRGPRHRDILLYVSFTERDTRTAALRHLTGPRAHHGFTRVDDAATDGHPLLNTTTKMVMYVPPTRTREDYLRDLSRSRYVLSPEGNGIDCHRTWEAILMGAIPIVQSHTLDELYRDAPVLVVQDFRNVTAHLLLAYTPPTWNRTVVWADTWFRRFQADQQRLRTPLSIPAPMNLV